MTIHDVHTAVWIRTNWEYFTLSILKEYDSLTHGIGQFTLLPVPTKLAIAQYSEIIIPYSHAPSSQ